MPSFSPYTGEYPCRALHCIQSHAASSSHRMPVWLATSRYSGSARSSGILAEVTNASRTEGGMCAWYTVSVAAGVGLLAGDVPGVGEELPAGAPLAAEPPVEFAVEPAGAVGAVAGMAWTRPGTSALPCARVLAAAGTGVAAAGIGLAAAGTGLAGHVAPFGCWVPGLGGSVRSADGRARGPGRW